MAKIALLTKKLTPQALGLAQALQFHRHEITIMTSASEVVPDNLGFPVLTYFKKWSALEALRFFPRILGQAPDVWHFVFSDSKTEKPSGAQLVLASLARALPGRVVASSFYDSLFEIPGHRLAPFTRLCDIVTTATRENLMYLKRRGWLGKHTETEVLPPFVLNSGWHEKVSQDPDLGQLIAAIQPYLLLPSEHLPSFDWQEVLSSINVVVCGPRPQKPIKALGFQEIPQGLYFVGHPISDSQMLQLLQASRGLLTAGDEYSVIELLHFHRLCFHTKSPVLASPRQAEALPGFCVNQRNGFLLDQNLRTFKKLLVENEELILAQPLFESLKSDITDSALNELNRLYAQIQHMKTSAFDRKSSSLS